MKKKVGILIVLLVAVIGVYSLFRKNPDAAPEPMAINAPKPEAVTANTMSFEESKIESKPDQPSSPAQENVQAGMSQEEFEALKTEAKAKIEKSIEDHLRNHSLASYIRLEDSELKCENDNCLISIKIDPQNQIAKTQLLTEVSNIWAGVMKDYRSVIKNGSSAPKDDAIDISLEFYEENPGKQAMPQ